ncbi:hypothetical protein P6F26_08435 [Roseibacterium sp. SDUM158017]|uniref:hypothetical protein n=1 Tax=Roseicyclus salinarum TaxID=3036773 RepID=UPI00241580A3|nr:hypothetical protein [Roseibacterium sp. SDUM158017]MDG4648471.1 hypothetical protein [Roseibacterium sp. SDUM158017]
MTNRLPRFPTLIPALCLAVALGVLTPLPAAAQSPFAVAVQVNDDIVTNYEIQQRRQFLSLLNAPAEVVSRARETLVNERLQNQAAERLGVTAGPDEIEAAVAEFAGRANMSPQQFIGALGQAGVAPETVRDFLEAGVNWRNVVRARFAQAAAVSNDEIDRALSINRTGGAPDISAIDYATIPIAGGRSGNALARAQALRDSVDTCDDLYGVRPAGLERQQASPSQIPQDVAAALTRLDANEMSFDVVRGDVLLVTMLCERTTAAPEGARDQVREQLFQQRMQAYASSFLEELRADAIITYSDG